jgi:hypothetical protein
VTFRGLGVLKGDIGCLEDFLLDLDLVERFLSGVVGFSASMSCDQFSVTGGCYESRASGLTVPFSVLSSFATFTQRSEHLDSLLPSSWDRSELRSVDIDAGDTYRFRPVSSPRSCTRDHQSDQESFGSKYTSEGCIICFRSERGGLIRIQADASITTNFMYNYLELVLALSHKLDTLTLIVSVIVPE